MFYTAQISKYLGCDVGSVNNNNRPQDSFSEGLASPTTPSKQGSSGASATSVNSATAAVAVSGAAVAEKTSSLRKTLDHRRQLVMQLFQDNGLFPSNQESTTSVSQSGLRGNFFILLKFN